MARLKQGLSLVVDGPALFGADHVGGDVLPGDRAVVGQGVGIEEAEQAAEGIGLALVRGGGEEQQVGRGLGQTFAESEASHGFCGAPEAMGLVDHHQIPAGVDEVVEALAVVASHLLRTPAPAGLHRFDRIEGADHLVVLLPEVFLGADPEQLAPGGEVAGLDEVKGFIEVGVELADPLADQTRWSHHKNPLGQAADLELTNDQARFDGFAQANLIGEEIADPISCHGALQRLELVRQGDDGTLQRCDQGVVLKGIEDASRGGHKAELLEAGGAGLLQGLQPRNRETDHCVPAGQPDLGCGDAPEVFHGDHPAGLAVIQRVTPVAGCEAHASSPSRV